MQDSRCDSDMDFNHRKLKISSERREFFSQIFIFSNFGMFVEHLKLQIRDILFFRNFEKNQKFKIENDLFINATALRAPPAVTRLTVDRRLQYRGVCLLGSYAVFEIYSLAIERKRFLEICSLLLCNMNFPTCNWCVRSILTDRYPLGSCSLRVRSPSIFEKMKFWFLR